MSKKEYTGRSVSYYRVSVTKPTSPDVPPYVAECNDIIEALGMNYAEANVFKAIWRSCAAKNLDLSKRGYDDLVYDAEKALFFSARVLAQRQEAKATPHHLDEETLAAVRSEPNGLNWEDE